MSKSIVVAYCGGRGSGKTESMSVECALTMIEGKKVWCNYPLGFNWRDDDGKIIRYDGELIEIEDLIKFRDDIRNGCVALDELNLWANCRNSTAIINRLLNSWIQLLRHRGLSLLITAQSFDTLDKVIKWQTDLICNCFDLSYKYKNLKEGEYISQMVTDYSGVYTGRPLSSFNNWDDWVRNTRTRIMHGSVYWGIYDTMAEFDILKAMTRYQVERETRIIGRTDGFKHGFVGECIKEMTESLRGQHPNGFECSPDEMKERLTKLGIDGGLNKITGGFLKKAGFSYKYSRKKGNYYALTESSCQGG